MQNIFLLSSKHIPFEQYYRLRVSGQNIAICETKSNNVFVLTHTSFDQNNFYFLHAVQKAVDDFNDVLKDFGFFQYMAPHASSIQPILRTSYLASCSSFVIFVADFRRSFIFDDFQQLLSTCLAAPTT